MPFEHCLLVLTNTHLSNKETWACRKQQLQFKQWDHNHTIVLSTLFLFLTLPTLLPYPQPWIILILIVSPPYPNPYAAVPLTCSFRAHTRYENYTKWLAGTHTKQWTINHTKWGSTTQIDSWPTLINLANIKPHALVPGDPHPTPPRVCTLDITPSSGTLNIFQQLKPQGMHLTPPQTSNKDHKAHSMHKYIHQHFNLPSSPRNTLD